MSNTEGRDYRLTKKGQVTVPKNVREHLGVSEGEAVRFEVEPDGDVVIRKSEANPSKDAHEERMRKAIEAAQAHVDLQGMTPEEYMIWIRD